MIFFLASSQHIKAEVKNKLAILEKTGLHKYFMVDVVGYNDSIAHLNMSAIYYNIYMISPKLRHQTYHEITFPLFNFQLISASDQSIIAAYEEIYSIIQEVIKKEENFLQL